MSQDRTSFSFKLGAGVLFVGWVLLFVSFLFRPDLLTAVTVIPAWSWALMGMLSSAPLLLGARRWFVVNLGLWLVFLALFAEEPYGWFRSSLASKSGFRVVTCNWGGAKLLPVEDLVDLEPDLLLIQETPKLEILQDLAKELGLELLYSPEAAILGSGDLVEISRGVHFLKARWNQTEVISLRLSPPLVRFDLWNPNCWSAYRDRRLERREQLEFMMEGGSTPALVGGDFNVPAGDGALSALEGLRDCFDAVGSGQPNTAPSYLPLHRVDQLWASPSFQPAQAYTRLVSGSDHRALVVDFQSLRSLTPGH